jgi:hypothetical protein
VLQQARLTLDMKVLYKDKIVETFQFPFAEALSFSILLWTTWGLLESFYWQRIAPVLHLTNERLHPLIYIIAFLLYLTIALVVAAFAYSIVKWTLFTLELKETALFRAVTLSFILAIFIIMVLVFLVQRNLLGFANSQSAEYGFLAAIVVISTLAIYLLYTRASDEGFRIRGSGTMMFSIVVLSLILSFVPFPIFASGPENPSTTLTERKLDLTSSMKKLLAYHYVDTMTPQSK